MAWTCPECGRQFRRTRQSHECAPAMALDDYFATGPPHERPVFEAVMAHLATLGPVHVEPVSVGIFIKRDGSFMELRPMERWVAMSFPLRRRAQHRTIVRKVMQWHGRYYHIANVRQPEDLDEALLDLITESYADA
jgi:Domain of unknown function (DUF5655)